MMQDVMSGDSNDITVKQLFVDQGISSRDDSSRADDDEDAPPPPAAPSERLKGIICTVKEGFGFIKCPQFPNNVFFHFSALQNCDFGELMEGDLVSFTVEQREKEPVAKDVELMEDDKS